MDAQQLFEMGMKGLAEYIGTRIENGEPFTQDERMELHDALGRYIAWAGDLWDRVDGVNPNAYTGSRPIYGTPNRRSMTYKARKLAGYSYP